MSQSTEGLKIQATDIVTFQLIFKNIPFLEKKKIKITLNYYSFYHFIQVLQKLMRKRKKRSISVWYVTFEEIHTAHNFFLFHCYLTKNRVIEKVGFCEYFCHFL